MSGRTESPEDLKRSTECLDIVSLPSAGRKAKVMEHSNDLGAEDDDIITDAQSPIPQHSLFSAPHGHSQPVGKVFVERNSECESEFTASGSSERHE